MNPLVVVETHPVQYRAPVYRWLQTRLGVPVTVIYGSDFSITGYHDREFSATLAWDTDLLSGYTSCFLTTVRTGGPRRLEQVSPRGVAEAVRRAAPGAVLLTGTSPWFHQAAFLAARGLGVPLLFRGETTDHARRRTCIGAAVRDRILRWGYRQCARLLYVGQRSRDHFRRLGVPDARLGFSPYCVDAALWHPTDADRARVRTEARTALGIGDHQRVLLFSGKLVPRKQPDLLLRAVNALPEAERTTVVVAFLGDGPLAAALAEAAARPPAVPVRFLGFKNQTALSPYYHAADLLVLPSREDETWGLVVNEALHHGLPCVVSEAVGCAPDLIRPGVTGELCRADSAESLAAGLSRAGALIGRPDVRAACRTQVAGYTVERAAEGIAAAYRAAVTRRGPP